MDTAAPEWDHYQTKFTELAELADKHPLPAPPLDKCQFYLCLYGENGLKPAEELAMLTAMEPFVGDNLHKVDVTTSYWEDTVLFVK